MSRTTRTRAARYRGGTVQLTESSGLKHVPPVNWASPAFLPCLSASIGSSPLMDSWLACSWHVRKSHLL